MAELFLLFSHQLTKAQEQDALAGLKVRKINYLPKSLQPIWSQIPPELECIKEHIQPIKDWLEENIKGGDYILIQGDFGATYKMVNWAISQKCIPIYATTSRNAIETIKNGKVISQKVFEHVRYRRYIHP